MVRLRDRWVSCWCVCEIVRECINECLCAGMYKYVSVFSCKSV